MEAINSALVAILVVFVHELVQELEEHSANTLMARAFEEGGANYPRWKVEILVELLRADRPYPCAAPPNPSGQFLA